MDFLGFHVCNGKLSIDPSKIADIHNYDEQFSTVKEVCKFLGIVSYQRAFIKNFAKIARPLHDLTCKDIPLIWTDECPTAVQMLKAAVTSEPALALPDQNQQFELKTDASNIATRAILYQREPHPDDTTDQDGYPIFKGKQCTLGYYSHGLTPIK